MEKKNFKREDKNFKREDKNFRRDEKPFIREDRREKKLFRDDDKPFNENQLEGRNAALEVLKSGRDVDKIALTGLTPIISDNTVYFDEARLVLICKKQYVGKLSEKSFTDTAPIDKWYPDKDYHNMIIGKIHKVLIK